MQQGGEAPCSTPETHPLGGVRTIVSGGPSDSAEVVCVVAGACVLPPHTHTYILHDYSDYPFYECESYKYSESATK